ncbi:protein prune homolog 2-like isoform X2 [Uloborus diversus]|uniref:protein prune homolog 2-like isoform X2 n=1 Tax=Uloborus diversus TaxID=327109 RepID=UPI00240919A8|nr:protein prune homolog 2-like isoform X2 [Uloborus diversus]
METFLHEIKQNLKNSNASSNIHVVLGNEACDLDSAVSSLVMAYFLHKMHSPTVISIPVLNVVRKDLALRNEVVYFLEETHIPINCLICLDEINLKALSENENFTVTLVDHNLLSDEQTYLQSKVVQIVDHHSVDCEERLRNIDCRIEEAGSCCSLVADMIFNSNEASMMDPQIAMLLYGTIILDTVCLQESAKRVKEIDRKIVSKLEPYLEGISREEIFGTLRKVKFDVSSTSTVPDHVIKSDKTTLSNGFQHENSLNYSDDTIPTYKAEPLDFPESPKFSKFLDITVELKKLKSDENDEDLTCKTPEPEEIKLENGNKVTEGTGTLKRISVHRSILDDNKEMEEDQRSLSSLSNKSDLDVFSATDDIIIPDDNDTLDELENSDCDYIDSPMSDPIPEMSAAEEFEEERSWKSCHVGGEERRIDMKVIEPYRKVLSHGGYQGDAHNAIIIFSACYLPDRSRKDYDYVMDNLFLYVITTLNELVAEDYVLVYLHGATERSNMPSFRWLKRCYQMIDRRLRKNLKGLYLVHPTFWLKTIVIMTRPFISSKFTRKLQFVYSLQELSSLIPLDHVSIPDKVKQFDEDLFPD